MKAHIFPSLISANLLTLKFVIDTLNSHCDGFHIDIMDNHFVPNLTWGAQFANAIDAATLYPSWVHLMVDNPEVMIRQLNVKPKSIISFHLESTKQVQEVIETIHDRDWIASIAVKPSTDLRNLYAYLPYVQHVLLMSVEPGFSGQAFIPGTFKRLQELNAYRDAHSLVFTIGMDGGISEENIKKCYQEGAHDFAIASAIFSHTNYIKAVEKLRMLIES